MPTLKDGNLILRRVRVGQSVRPGGSIVAEVDISNGEITDQSDPDRCVNSNTECTRNFIAGTAPGYCISIEIDTPSGIQNSGPMCIGQTLIGTADATIRFTFTAPTEPGDYTVSAIMETNNTGQRTSSVMDTFTVSETSPVEPEPPDNGNGGGDGGGGTSDLTELVLTHPVESLVVGIGGAIALREAFGGDE